MPKSKKRKNKNRSKIKQHKRTGKKLVPPLMQVPNVNLTSWRDNRLPEILWAAILISNLERNKVLDIFRNVAEYIHNQGYENEFWDITHTGLSKFPPKKINEILEIIIQGDEEKEILSPLMLLSETSCEGILETCTYTSACQNRPYSNDESNNINFRSSITGIN